VVVDIGHERFVLLAHLKRGSVCVSRGQQVQRGQKLAECGNSGNTSEPHIHLQVQSRADFEASDLRTFPILFRDVARVRSGQRKQLQEADVRANDILIAPDN
jgi:murein DD-endopeptidase MepM/ murein hydrolase activator NlpD